MILHNHTKTFFHPSQIFLFFSFSYIYGCISQDELAAFYREAAVGLVTPLRDGMNLVAKEFVACQINTPPGVLVVSPFAGAGETMHEALVCNPYEIDGASEVIHRWVNYFLIDCVFY